MGALTPVVYIQTSESFSIFKAFRKIHLPSVGILRSISDTGSSYEHIISDFRLYSSINSLFSGMLYFFITPLFQTKTMYPPILTRGIPAYVNQFLYCRLIEWLQTAFGLVIGFIGLFDTARDYILQYTVTRSRVHYRCSRLPKCPRPQLQAF
jgi:hypothetical protein